METEYYTKKFIENDMNSLLEPCPNFKILRFTWEENKFILFKITTNITRVVDELIHILRMMSAKQTGPCLIFLYEEANMSFINVFGNRERVYNLRRLSIADVLQNFADTSVIWKYSGIKESTEANSKYKKVPFANIQNLIDNIIDYMNQYLRESHFRSKQIHSKKFDKMWFYNDEPTKYEPKCLETNHMSAIASELLQSFSTTSFMSKNFESDAFYFCHFKFDFTHDTNVNEMTLSDLKLFKTTPEQYVSFKNDLVFLFVYIAYKAGDFTVRLQNSDFQDWNNTHKFPLDSTETYIILDTAAGTRFIHSQQLK